MIAALALIASVFAGIVARIVWIDLTKPLDRDFIRKL